MTCLAPYRLRVRWDTGSLETQLSGTGAEWAAIEIGSRSDIDAVTILDAEGRIHGVAVGAPVIGPIKGPVKLIEADTHKFPNLGFGDIDSTVRLAEVNLQLIFHSVMPQVFVTRRAPAVTRAIALVAATTPAVRMEVPFFGRKLATIWCKEQAGFGALVAVIGRAQLHSEAPTEAPVVGEVVQAVLMDQTALGASSFVAIRVFDENVEYLAIELQRSGATDASVDILVIASGELG